MDLLLSLADGISFKVAVLLAIAAAYVLFELMLLALGSKRKPTGQPQLAVEAFTTWTSRHD